MVLTAHSRHTHHLVRRAEVRRLKSFFELCGLIISCYMGTSATGSKKECFLRFQFRPLTTGWPNRAQLRRRCASIPHSRSNHPPVRHRDCVIVAPAHLIPSSRQENTSQLCPRPRHRRSVPASPLPRQPQPTFMAAPPSGSPDLHDPSRGRYSYRGKAITMWRTQHEVQLKSGALCTSTTR
jgi:hypothetical protein